MNKLEDKIFDLLKTGIHSASEIEFGDNIESLLANMCKKIAIEFGQYCEDKCISVYESTFDDWLKETYGN